MEYIRQPIRVVFGINPLAIVAVAIAQYSLAPYIHPGFSIPHQVCGASFFKGGYECIAAPILILVQCMLWPA